MNESIVATGLEWLNGTVQPLASDTTIEVRSWAEVALADRRQFSSDLSSMKVGGALRQEALSMRDEVASGLEGTVASFWKSQGKLYLRAPDELLEEAQLIYDSERISALSRLRDWWEGRVVTVESREAVLLRLPLFLLSAPNVEGCSAEFKSVGSDQSSRGFSLSITGTGLAGEATINVKKAAAFHADWGQQKVVFVPATLTLETVLIAQAGRRQLRTHRLDVAGLPDDRVEPGVILLDAQVTHLPDDSVATFPLSEDSSGAVAKYTYNYAQVAKKSRHIGLKAGEAEVKVEATSEISKQISVDYNLVSGRDYHLYRPQDIDGLVFAE